MWDEENQAHAVKKAFKTKNKYERERDFYYHSGNILPFIPRILRHLDEEKTIWTEYCGISLNIKYLPEERYILKQKIRLMVNTFEKTLGLFHNDIRWKNIVENDDKRLFLIDFEVVSKDNKERDPEWILRDKPKKYEKNSNSI